MRLIRFVDPEGTVWFGTNWEGEEAEVLTGGPSHRLRATGQRARVDRLLAPIAPPNIYCVGLNYRAHAAEANLPLPETPVVFMKPTSSVAAPEQPIRIPRCCEHGDEVDYECELAVVIGQEGRDIPVRTALDHVFGYTAANDVSARRWQKANGGQWVRGKSFDTFCPLGPALITRDAIADPQRLRLRTILNGEVVQDGVTDDMIFPVAEIVSFLSRDTTLLPGTVILTGTPPGVGFARNPPVFLKAGDQVAVEVEQIGLLVNPVV
jgi:2-keto-4-pentenoate hydratase/2-oxohepta-3-ene-1,7-dioic acid hydratase in catechol pathway